MKRVMFFVFALFMCVVSAFSQTGEEVTNPDFLEGFESFGTLVSIVIPAVVGFISSKLQNPMNKWVTMWVTAVVAIAVTFFSWWMDLGFPPENSTVWMVLIYALFIALASTGIVSLAISEWLAKLFGGKVKNE